MSKDEKKADEREKTAGAQELSDEELEQVSGGGAFSGVPRVKTHDYTQEVKDRA